jgi:hypothetical protein
VAHNGEIAQAQGINYSPDTLDMTTNGKRRIVIKAA